MADSTNEHWRIENTPFELFMTPIQPETLHAGGGPMFDFTKLGHFGRCCVARLSAEDVIYLGLQWADQHASNFAKKNEHNAGCARAALCGDAEARKDIGKWSFMGPDRLHTRLTPGIS